MYMPTMTQRQAYRLVRSYKMPKQYIDKENCVRLIKDNLEIIIPKDEANSDYQRYLRWLENPDADESGTL